ncbi:hypothetical protein EGH22_06550 [Halomicroarcula sp. F28]|uniref:hypothetical protein n=1 Tax=Haloarcula salinisoli TaxID=2487746 RepID=UPI001C72CAF5|nr:hypothetical protein [Halomicroarcula salinisoli]MBX0285979.1 hypothetical protein [Halomicroarcula salinisoli]
MQYEQPEEETTNEPSLSAIVDYSDGSEIDEQRDDDTETTLARHGPAAVRATLVVVAGLFAVGLLSRLLGVSGVFPVSIPAVVGVVITIAGLGAVLAVLWDAIGSAD